MSGNRRGQFISTSLMRNLSVLGEIDRLSEVCTGCFERLWLLLDLLGIRAMGEVIDSLDTLGFMLSRT